jgi:hypothetical protein
MIQYQDSPWMQPCPLPIPDKPLAEPAVPPCQGAAPMASAPQPERQPVGVSPDDDSQWMLLL